MALHLTLFLQARMYYELEADTLQFVFPVPGRLDGVKSRYVIFLKKN